MSIFKAYDVRGIYPREINADIVYKIGRAIVIFLKAKEVVVGHDMRMSSNVLHNALIEGITDQGADVIDIGLCSTPMLYFAARNKAAGVMITASHNPSEYNGLKVCGKNVAAISSDSGLKKIEEIVKKGKLGRIKKKGKLIPKAILNEYLEHNLKSTEGINDLRVVLDYGNGMGGLEFPKFMEKIPGVKAIHLFQDPDGRFPNHEPNPIKKENLKQLVSSVIKNNADLGISTDGDADRIGLVDEKGNMIPCDLTLALLAKELLKSKKQKETQSKKTKKQKSSKKSKEPVLYEVRTSKAVREAIEEYGGKPVIYKAGQSFMKDKMRKDNILVGGEKSGHYFFRDSFFAESPPMALAIIMKLLSEEKAKGSSGSSLSKLVSPLKKYSNSGEINFKVADADKTISTIEKKFRAQKAKIIKIDGITVEFRDWWFNLRKSNTEPVVRLNLEAKDNALMKKKLKELSGMIKTK